MAQKRKRWLTSGILIIGVVALLGFSIAPFVSSFSAAPPVGGAQSTPTSQAFDLKSQERGYAAVLQREPENEAALQGLVETRFRLGDTQGLVEPLQRLTKLNPQESLYGLMLAEARQKLGDREGAARAYRDLLAKSPGDPQALEGLVAILLQEQRPEMAVGLLQSALQTAAQQQANPTVAPPPGQSPPPPINQSDVRWILARVYAAQQRYDEANQVYEQMGRANAKDFRPLLGKALILRQQGKAEEAQAMFASAAALAPPEAKDVINRLATLPATPPAATSTPAPAEPATPPAPAATP